MSKPLKIVLAVIGALVALIVVAAIALPLLFDPNAFRDRISRAVQEETGRSFAVGNIELEVFPWLRVAVDEVVLGNAEGFGDAPFAAVRQLGVGVRLMPLLFDRQIMIDDVTLDGLQLNLAVNEQGANNWQDLLERQDQEPETPGSEAPEGSGFALEDIGSVRISDAAVRYRDAQAGAAYRIEPLNLETGALTPGEPFDVDLALTAHAEAQKLVAEFTLAAEVTPAVDSQRYSLQDARLGFAVNAGAPALKAEGELAAQLVADLAQQLFTADDIRLDVKLAGEPVPGGTQSASLRGKARFDQKAGTLAFDDGRIEAAGLVATAQIRGENLGGDAPRLSGPVQLQTFSPRELLQRLQIPLETADPQALGQASLQAQYSGSFSSAAFENLVLTLDQTRVTGRLAITDFASQALAFSLDADQIDADRYLPPEQPEQPQAAEPGGSGGDVNAIEIPTEALDKLNADGTLRIGTLTVEGVKMSDVRLSLASSGAARTQNLQARLYGGSIALNNRYAGGDTPSFALQSQLDALQAAPFLADFLGKDYVSGLANLKLDLKSSGNTVGALRRALDGSVSFRVENGAVKGFNLGQVLRKGQALLDGQSPGTATAVEETDFATLTGSASIDDGVLKVGALDAASPAFRLTGNGRINLVDETIQFVAKPTVVETTKGQGGKELEALKGLTIPIEISGNLFSPSYKVALDDVVKNVAREKAREAVKDKLAEELDLPKDAVSEDQLKQKAAEKLGDLLFGRSRKKDAPAEPAAQTPEPSAEPADAAAPAETPAAAEPEPG